MPFIPVAGNASALRCMSGGNAGHTSTVRTALEQQAVTKLWAVTMLFLQLNPWSSGERRFIFNNLREVVFHSIHGFKCRICQNYLQTYDVIIKLGHNFYIIGTHSNNVLIWFTKRILGTVFCDHFPCVPNDYN